MKKQIKRCKKLPKNITVCLVAVTLMLSVVFTGGGLVARAELLAANLDVTSGTINGGTTVKISGTGLPYKYVASTQDFGTDTCARLEVYDGTNPEVIMVLSDARNNQDYQIARLADGNCWMLNNLKISLADVASNPDLSKHGINTAALASQTVPNSEYIRYLNEPRYYDPGGSGNIAESDFYGYLYNWCAATGGTAETCTESGIQLSDSTTDICPVGWRLPKGGAYDDVDNEFSQLSARMAGFSDNQDAGYVADFYGHYDNWYGAGPFNGRFSGYWHSNLSTIGQGYYMWSGTADGSANYARGLFVDSSFVMPEDSSNRGYGAAVRCLAYGNTQTTYTASIPLAVMFDGIEAEIVSYTETEIIVRTPAHEAGAVNVELLVGEEALTLLNAYMYVPEIPDTGFSWVDGVDSSAVAVIVAMVLSGAALAGRSFVRYKH